jgi:N-acetylated-alpha-linked acidic dipeptidase
LIGSTEWVEDHMPELKEKTVIYVNTDGNSRGFLSAGGSHSLQTMVGEVAEAVTDPQTDVSVAARRKAALLVMGEDPEFKLSALGSGSDYSPFLQHSGIASLNIGYGGEGSGGEYHTIYDTYPHYKRFKDPDFSYGIALAKTTGRIVLRMANADVLPLTFKPWHTTVSTYLEEIIALTNDMREKREKYNGMVKSRAFELAADPQKPFVKPEIKPIIPFLDFSAVQNALAALSTTIDSLNTVDMQELTSGKKVAINAALQKLEQSLTDPEGLPRRPWYQHMIYAPGFYTGYGVKTLPGIREAVEQEEWEEAEEQIQVVAETLQRFDDAIKNMIALAK